MAKEKKKPSSNGRASKPKAEKRAPKEPKKYAEEGDKIWRLRNSVLGASQSKFAGMAHVAQSRIPAWESGAERPTKEAFLRLGLLARSEPTLRDWFWEQAGDMLELAEVVGEQSLRKRGEILPVFNVPCVRRVGRDNERTGETWPVNAGLVTSPGSTCCLLIGEETYSRGLRPGDAVVIDASSVHDSGISPFLDQIVLVDIDASKPRQLDPDRELIDWPDGLHIGRLRIKLHWQRPPVDVPVPGQRAFLRTETTTVSGSPLWLAALAAPGDLDQDWDPHGSSIYLGVWTPDSWPGSLDAASWQSWIDQCSEKAPGAIQLEEACSILGRVIEWAPSGGNAHAAAGRERRRPE